MPNIHFRIALNATDGSLERKRSPNCYRILTLDLKTALIRHIDTHQNLWASVEKYYEPTTVINIIHCY